MQHRKCKRFLLIICNVIAHLFGAHVCKTKNLMSLFLGRMDSRKVAKVCLGAVVLI